MFKDHRNNGFQKELRRQNTIYEYSPLQLSTLATPLNSNLFQCFYSLTFPLPFFCFFFRKFPDINDDVVNLLFTYAFLLLLLLVFSGLQHGSTLCDLMVILKFMPKRNYCITRKMVFLSFKVSFVSLSYRQMFRR